MQSYSAYPEMVLMMSGLGHCSAALPGSEAKGQGHLSPAVKVYLGQHSQTLSPKRQSWKYS